MFWILKITQEPAYREKFIFVLVSLDNLSNILSKSLLILRKILFLFYKQSPET